MPPKISDLTHWHQAEQLFQPAFIRLIDNLGKQLEASDWQGTYEDDLIWPPGVTSAEKAQVLELRQALQTAPPSERPQLQQQLETLPTPQANFQLRLKHTSYPDQETLVNLWEVCYQICFQVYDPTNPQEQLVSIDTTLLDGEGEVDWEALDQKTIQRVGAIFDRLPLP